MLDLAITGATVVDGGGGRPVTADVGIRDGRVAAVGTLDEPARETLDADGLVVGPGFVDPHTHYDAQLWWDPFATPSSWHGVTSVIGGNCGFTLAPLHKGDGDYLRRMMAQVEGMPLAALEEGVDWKWESFGEFLGGLDGNLGVNAGFLVGHCALRRYVMGPDAIGREATEREVAEMAGVLRRSLAAGGLGLSTTRSSTHKDGDGEPVASRWASPEELISLCRVVGEYPGTTLEGMVQGCLDRFSDDEIELFATMSATAGRPLNWNVLTVDSTDADKIAHQLRAAARARELGGRVVALTMPILVPMNMSFRTFCALWLIPGWDEVLRGTVEERVERLSDPRVREDMLAKARASSFARLAEFGNYVIGDAFHPDLREFVGRRVDEMAAERGEDPFTTLAGIVCKDELRTVLWPQPTSDTANDWALRSLVWEHPDVMLGGSDAGAHLDRMCGSPYFTRFLADSLRGRRLVSLERAVQLLSDVPARLFGLRGRGRLEPGYHADVVVFDPATVDAGPATLVPDLPGESPRLIAESVGVKHVFVNGVETIRDGVPTGRLPGTVLRSGTETDTVQTRKAALR
ncbi:amidohydrolase family protein [Actinomadura syzygii]|uniref:D-aminoacylase n=1 Tax=Actinomadura syzygii TaxID=1427538 RepID=A0A5D0TUK0_9ACTN|nr:D-aminoacylase [Actinomadura syzygii]TYC09036.1 D-aminoacylase [Actinomadura syzygii]